jgi:hypothetical protein
MPMMTQLKLGIRAASGETSGQTGGIHVTPPPAGEVR